MPILTIQARDVGSSAELNPLVQVYQQGTVWGLVAGGRAPLTVSVIAGKQCYVNLESGLDPVPGYTFQKWNDGVTTKSRLLTISANTTIVALWTKAVPARPVASITCLADKDTGIPGEKFVLTGATLDAAGAKIPGVTLYPITAGCAVIPPSKVTDPKGTAVFEIAFAKIGVYDVWLSDSWAD